MKTLKEHLNESFLNEKIYILTGFSRAKGIPGKVQFAFKKKIETLGLNDVAQINKLWKEFVKNELGKIITTEVAKVVPLSNIDFITSSANSDWEVVALGKFQNELKFNGSGSNDFVINVAFNDDVNSAKYSRRLGGYVNSPVKLKSDIDIIGKYDSSNDNNVEIRSPFILSID